MGNEQKREIIASRIRKALDILEIAADDARKFYGRDSATAQSVTLAWSYTYGAENSVRVEYERWKNLPPATPSQGMR